VGFEPETRNKVKTRQESGTYSFDLQDVNFSLDSLLLLVVQSLVGFARIIFKECDCRSRGSRSGRFSVLVRLSSHGRAGAVGPPSLGKPREAELTKGSRAGVEGGAVCWGKMDGNWVSGPALCGQMGGR
jgi:hypothetical protein